MSDEVGIINAAAEAARMCRLHNSSIDVEIRHAFGKRVTVRVTPQETTVDLGDHPATVELGPGDHADQQATAALPLSREP